MASNVYHRRLNSFLIHDRRLQQAEKSWYGFAKREENNTLMVIQTICWSSPSCRMDHFSLPRETCDRNKISFLMPADFLVSQQAKCRAYIKPSSTTKICHFCLCTFPNSLLPNTYWKEIPIPLDILKQDYKFQDLCIPFSHCFVFYHFPKCISFLNYFFPYHHIKEKDSGLKCSRCMEMLKRELQTFKIKQLT